MKAQLVLVSVLLISATAGCKGGADTVVDSYLNQPKCEDRAKFILEPEKYKDAIATKYRKNKDCVTEHGKVDASGCKDVAVGEYCTVSIEKMQTPYCVKRISDSEYKIDWPCSVGWNDVSAAELKSTRQLTPVPFRATVELSSNNPDEYPEDRFFAIKIEDNSGILSGFVRRKTPRGDALFDRIKGGGKHKSFLLLKHSAKTDDISHVFIVDVLADDWIHSPEVDQLLDRRAKADKALGACCNELSGRASASPSNLDGLAKLGQAALCETLHGDVVDGRKTPEDAVKTMREKQTEPLPEECTAGDKPLVAPPPPPAPPPEPDKPSCDTSKLSRPTVTMGAQVTINGRLAHEVIQKLVKDKMPEFTSCYDAGRCKDPKLEGRVSVRFAIDRDGKVSSTDDAGSDFSDAAVVSCVRYVFANMTFPQSEGISSVVYPITFSQGK